MDQNFFGSEVIETAVAPPPDMINNNKNNNNDLLNNNNNNDLLNNADVKYQGIPIYEDDVMEGKADSLVDLESEEDEDEEGSTQKSEQQQQQQQPAEKERNQENSAEQPKSLSVNYGYHPIIDFFDRYRFDAAA